MFDKNDLYSILHNPDEYEKRKEYDRQKKLFYGNELRFQIQENNKIKNQINENIQNLEFPLRTFNNKNSFFIKNGEISKDNNDYNNYNLYNNKYHPREMNYHYIDNGINYKNSFIPNLPYISNNTDSSNYNDINNNEYFINKNDLNTEKLFNNFIEFQINIINNYINIIDKLNNPNQNQNQNININSNNSNNINNKFESPKKENTNSPSKTFKEKYSFDNITFYNNTIDNNNGNYDTNITNNKNNIYPTRFYIEKEKKKAIDFIKNEKQKLDKELGYTPDDDYNNKIEELFNKITNKKIVKYSSILIPKNNNIFNENKTIEQNENENNNINNNINNNTSSDNTSKFDSNNNLNKSNNYTSDNNTYNNKDNKVNSNNTLKNMKNENKLENTENNVKALSPKRNYIFAFKNNSFNSNNNSEISKSSTIKNKKIKNNNNNSDNNEEKEDEESSFNSNKNEKDKEKNKNRTKITINKNPKKQGTYILSQNNNLMDIFSKNEKKRMKKFSINFKYKKINDLFYDENKRQKFQKKNTKQIYSFPVNQNFKNIKNISNDIKVKNSKIKFKPNSQITFPYIRARSRSYKDKKINNKLRKKIEDYNNNNNKNSDNNSKEIFNRNNSKNYSYSYRDNSNNLNIEKNGKINKRKNKRYYTGHFNYKKPKKKLSIQDNLPGLSFMLNTSEPSNYLFNKNKSKLIEKKPNFFNKRSSSYAKNNTIDEKMKNNFTNKFLNKRSGSSISNNNINNNNINNPILTNLNLNFNNDIYGEDDKLYKMIKNFENNVKERIKIDENKKISNTKNNSIQINNLQLNTMKLNHDIDMNMNLNMNNNLLLRNSPRNMGEVELIPKKYIFQCKKVIYPEIEAEKLRERERLLFGRNKYN